MGEQPTKIIYQVRRPIPTLFPLSWECLLPSFLTPGLFDTVLSSIGLDYYISSSQNSVNCHNEVCKPNLDGVSRGVEILCGFKAHTAEH